MRSLEDQDRIIKEGFRDLLSEEATNLHNTLVEEYASAQREIDEANKDGVTNPNQEKIVFRAKGVQEVLRRIATKTGASVDFNNPLPPTQSPKT